MQGGHLQETCPGQRRRDLRKGKKLPPDIGLFSPAATAGRGVRWNPVPQKRRSP